MILQVVQQTLSMFLLLILDVLKRLSYRGIGLCENSVVVAIRDELLHHHRILTH